MDWKEVSALGLLIAGIVSIVLAITAYNYYSDKIYTDAGYTHQSLPGQALVLVYAERDVGVLIY